MPMAQGFFRDSSPLPASPLLSFSVDMSVDKAAPAKRPWALAPQKSVTIQRTIVKPLPLLGLKSSAGYESGTFEEFHMGFLFRDKSQP
jgi:hypothetical protein